MTPAQSAMVERGAVELRRLIGQGELSPVELLDACIARINALNPAVNAITATCFDRARDEAKAAEAALVRSKHTLGLLHGLPLGVKDLQATQGLLTTYGNIGFRNHVPHKDTALVAQLRAAGAIVAAKTNVPDMGAGANTRNPVWGATGNPFNPQLNAGGSSGGSAAALATSMLPLCTGSDTGGSLRIPASLCGVVGLRPTPGLVPNDDRLLGWSAISVLGPMGRTVDDCALLMAASVGTHAMDPLSSPCDPQAFFPLPDVDASRLRIGFTDDLGGLALVAPNIRAAFRQRVEQQLRPLVKSVEPWQPKLGDADRAFDVLRAEAFVAGYADTYRTAPETLGPNVRANIELAERITLGDRAWAHLQQTRIARHFAQAFEHDFDLIVTPVTPLSPFPWTELYATQIDGQATKNYYHWLALTYIVTLATNPALSLPCGLDDQGMPFGLQLIGPLRQDAKLLAMAKALERGLGASVRPNLEALRVPQPMLKSIVTHPPGSGDGAVGAAATPV